MATLLLSKYKLDPDSKDLRGRTPLMHAVLVGNLEIVAALRKHNAELAASDICGWSALHFACERGDHVLVQELLR